MIRIGAKRVGRQNPCFIIAEAGVNHNGKLGLALQLVDVAADAGADAVKFQTFKAEEVSTESGKTATYQRRHIRRGKNQRDMLRRFELQERFYKPIIQRCREKNILFLSTPHGGKASVVFLESLGIVAYKIGSGDLTNYILLQEIAKTKKPIILSTGMTTLKEVQDAVLFIRSKKNHKIIVLHCTTNYPCLLEEVNLEAMLTMMQRLNVPVGYSDHTIGNQVAIMAAALGAAIYECHFTLDKYLSGPDHIASATPEELRAKIEAIRAVKTIMGNRIKKPTEKEEKEMIPLIRKSIVLTRNLSAGDTLTIDDLEAKRPGDGISPTKYEQFLGRKLKKRMKIDEQLYLRDLKKRIKLSN